MSILLCILLLSLASASSQPEAAAASQPVLEAADYGERLSDEQSVVLWWCDATRKVSRVRPAPAQEGEAVRLWAARNEFEAAQLVVRPGKDLVSMSCEVSDLTGPGGASIAAGNVQLLRVGYVHVTAPTDKLGTVGDWPDPLPPFTGPMDVPRATNQPLWVLVRVPKTAAPGDYQGRISLKAGDWSAVVPLRLHVWSFTLPDTPSTQSAFGFSMGLVANYQHLKTEGDQRAVFDKYMQSFADHRISTYDPTSFDPIEVKFVAEADPPRAEVSFERFDAAMQRALEQWHITSFRLHVPGMGGGTFHERHEGEIAGFKAGTPAYEAMFASAVRQIESHLREKGWLERAYVYWFDEPEPRDYDFVRAGMERLKKYAPGLRRMLTEEPVEPLFGCVDLWCPISNSFTQGPAEARRAKGEHFWWYVCTGPKAPFCTLFIDHPATDLRAWLWQTWQRKIDGILVWESNYWTSGTAFPDSLQDPYADPMSYVVGYGVPLGTKQPWGNGDGRFIYPPEAARAGKPLAGASGSDRPILDGPVSSLRWEMLREGMEDLEYLHILSREVRTARLARQIADPRQVPRVDTRTLAQGEGLLEVPPEITRGIKEYTFDPAPIYQRRQAIAEFIERVGRK